MVDYLSNQEEWCVITVSSLICSMFVLFRKKGNTWKLRKKETELTEYAKNTYSTHTHTCYNVIVESADEFEWGESLELLGHCFIRFVLLRVESMLPKFSFPPSITQSSTYWNLIQNYKSKTDITLVWYPIYKSTITVWQFVTFITKFHPGIYVNASYTYYSWDTSDLSVLLDRSDRSWCLTSG